jgi:7-carboxy-7-deazaguanine synthase (Cx14CxxC type)
MTYMVKSIFMTLQGEGRWAGHPAVFCRFSLCNLWTGHEETRHRAVCTFCDTDFLGTDGPGGGKFDTPEELAAAVAEKWPGGGSPMVVLTGGEPLLQVDTALTAALHGYGFYIAVETNGTRPCPPGIDWLCVSPKANAELALTAGDELKLVYPQPDAPPERFTDLNFRSFSIQPMDGPDIAENTRAAVEYCLAHPQWSLSMQTHKILEIR